MSMTPLKNSVPLTSVPRGWVTIASIGLVAAALAGTVLGVSRSLGAHDLPSDAGELTPTPNTTLAKALPADTVFDESRIRSIAREEAQAALVRSPPKPRPAPRDDTEPPATDPGDATAPALATPKAPALTVLKPAIAVSPRPATVVPPTPTTRSPTTSNPYPPGLTPN